MKTYALGYSADELDRLMMQDRLYDGCTRQMLEMAGIKEGDRVLDVGCGAGDVALRCAEIVGPSGSVVAVDRSPDGLAVTRRRAEDAGRHWVRTVEADIADYEADQAFDAVVGRLILMYLGDPARHLGRLAAMVVSGGTIAFAEQDTSAFSSDPPSPLLHTTLRFIEDALVLSGAEPNMGGKLHGAFLDAGLEARLATSTVVDAGSGSALIGLASAVAASIVAASRAAGSAAPAAIDVDGLAERWRAEADVERRTFYSPRFTIAVARRP